MDDGDAYWIGGDRVTAEQHAVVERRIIQFVGLSTRSLALVAFAAFGGPLALAALYAPGALDEVTGSGGLVVVAAAVAFIAPLAIWLRYSRDIASAGGLTAFVEAAAGRRIAFVQGSVWVASYALYLLYTGAYVAYDVLPSSISGIHGWRPWLAVLFPLGVAAALAAGRGVSIAVIGLFAVAQFAILVMLDVVAVSHAPSANGFHGTTSTGAGKAVAAVSALFVCGSLPLFLGGELRDRGRGLRRVLPPAFVLAAVGVLLAVYPYSLDPAFTRADVPGVALVRVDVGNPAADIVGVGVAASILAVMLLEGVALTRLLHFGTGVTVRTWTWVLAATLVVAGPVSLAIGAGDFYDSLLRPSLVLLWIAQLMVVLVFPLYLYRRRQLHAWHVTATLVATAVMTYALVTTVTGASAT